MRIRPCIDLKNGQVVQIVGGTLADTPASDTPTVVNFATTQPAAAFAARYRDDQLWGGHVIALGPGCEDAALSALSAFPGGMQMGGGITPDTASRFLDAGASHVIVTSYVFRDGHLDASRLLAMVEAVGRKRLVLDLSCRRRPSGEKGENGDYFVVTDRWQRFTNLAITAATLEALAEHCDEFLVHAVDVEGRRGGIDAALVAALADAPIPVTYAGGVRDWNDIRAVRTIGQGRIDLTVGSALDLFGGSLSYRELVNWQRQNPSPP